MSNVSKFPNRSEVKSIVGAERTGFSVVVDGREIPHLHCHPKGDATLLVVDGRFAFEFPNEWAWLAAKLAAECLAIGQGYAHSGSDATGHPFAPMVFEMEHKP